MRRMGKNVMDELTFFSSFFYLLANRLSMLPNITRSSSRIRPVRRLVASLSRCSLVSATLLVTKFFREYINMAVNLSHETI